MTTTSPRRGPGGMLISIVVLALLLLLGQQLLVGGEAGLGLGLPGARRGAHPLELARQRALAGRLGLLLALEPLLLLLEPGRVVALPRDAGAAVELEDPAGDVVEEVAVVGDGDDRARVLVQVVLEPGHALGVEVVGRLVEQQQVGALEQHPAERHAAALAARELGRRRRRPAAAGARPSRSPACGRGPSRWRPRSRPAACPAPRAACPSRRARGPRRACAFTSSKRVSSPLVLATASSTFPSTFLLGSSAAPAAGSRSAIPSAGLASPKKSLSTPAMIRSRVDLPDAVAAEDADLRAGVERQIDALQDLLVGRVNPPEVLHRVDVLVRHGGGSLAGPRAAGRRCTSCRSEGQRRRRPAQTSAAPIRAPRERALAQDHPGVEDGERRRQAGQRRDHRERRPAACLA